MSVAESTSIKSSLGDVEVEQALLGLLLCKADSGAVEIARQICSPDDLFDPLHTHIHRALLELREIEAHISPLTIKARLGDDPGLAEVGRHAYLGTLSAAAPAVGKGDSLERIIQGYGRIIKDLAQRRRISGELKLALQGIADRTVSLPNSLRPVLVAVDDAIATSTRSVSFSADQAGELFSDELESASLGHVPSIKSGSRLLDEFVGGLRAGQLAIVAGRPGMGKSTVATTLARAAAQEGHPCEFISLEMKTTELWARITSDVDLDNHGGEFPLTYSKLLRGTAKGQEFERAVLANQCARQLPITIHCPAAMTMQEIAALARARAARAPVMGIVIIDHMGLIQPSDRYRGRKVDEISEITAAAKALARNIGWPVVLLSQLNRQVEQREGRNRRPTLSDLRDSGSIEQDADIVIGLYRPGYYIGHKRPANGDADPSYGAWKTEWLAEKNDLELIVLKNRNGETGIVTAWCEIGASAIRDTAPPVCSEAAHA